MLLTPLAGARRSHVRSELEATWARSAPGPVTSTADGAIGFTSESGVLAVFGATGLGGGSDSNRFERALKREPISSQGVRPVELLIDPDAAPDLEGAPGREEVHYVAGAGWACGR